MNVETAIFEVLEAAIAGAADTDALFEAELHDTLYAPVTKLYGIRIGNVDADLAPMPGVAEVGEFNAGLLLQCFAQVQGVTADARRAARDKATALAHAVALIIFGDPSLGGRVRDLAEVHVHRGWAQVKATPYAVAVLTATANDNGQQVEG
jgi:hypothetical protein